MSGECKSRTSKLSDADKRRHANFMAMLRFVLADNIRSANCVVFATPVYYYDLSESLRAFLEVPIWRVKRLADALLIPYTLSTGFATVLNYTIWRMNV